MTAAQFRSFPTRAPSFGAVRSDKASGLGLIVICSALALALAALWLALGFGPDIAAALAEG